jgi:hypothetical protein
MGGGHGHRGQPCRLADGERRASAPPDPLRSTSAARYGALLDPLRQALVRHGIADPEI